MKLWRKATAKGRPVSSHNVRREAKQLRVTSAGEIFAERTVVQTSDGSMTASEKASPSIMPRRIAPSSNFPDASIETEPPERPSKTASTELSDTSR